MDYGREGPPNPLTNTKFLVRMISEGWEAMVAALVMVFGLAAGHGPDVNHCIAIACSFGCISSTTASLAACSVFLLKLRKTVCCVRASRLRLSRLPSLPQRGHYPRLRLPDGVVGAFDEEGV